MTDNSATHAIDIREVRKDFGSVTALQNVSLTIRDREFFTLLGPSGCGKTTLLRLIAGFESVTAGTIHLYGEEIEDLPPDKRPVNTVFQQYSLFPHMTVAENVRFGLEMKRADGAHIAQRTRQMLELVQLSDLAERKSTQLSGGQQQRVALARALAPEPQVLLLDEPLSALDLKLRQAMRMELKQIQQETGITFVFVTHDQEEALTMSDRIAVMSHGEIQQIGSAQDIYGEPCNQFVADFIGETNLLDSHALSTDGRAVTCELPGGGHISCTASKVVTEGTRGKLCIRPERLSLIAPRGAEPHLQGVVRQLVYLGTDTQLTVRLDSGIDVLLRQQNSDGTSDLRDTGEPVSIRIDDGAARFLVD